MATPRSPLMDALYGTEESQKVYDRLESLDPLLNRLVQDEAYNRYWAMPGLSIIF